MQVCVLKRPAPLEADGLALPSDTAFGSRNKSTAAGRHSTHKTDVGGLVPESKSATLPKHQRLLAPNAVARTPLPGSPQVLRAQVGGTNTGAVVEESVAIRIVILHMERGVNGIFDVFIKSTEIDGLFDHVVDGVEDGTFAAQGGLIEKDVIVGLGGRDATRLSGAELWTLLDTQGTTFDVGVRRVGGKRSSSTKSTGSASTSQAPRRRRSLLTVEGDDTPGSDPHSAVAADVETEDLSCCIAPLDMQAYTDLDFRKVLQKDVPPYARGTKLNRYFDILPSPLTRVILPETGLPPDPASTYINANYIRGFGGKSAKEYIAAQGPNTATVEAFIRMIWHRTVRVIVMVTGFVEKGKNKCERYFPETPGSKPMVFGAITVRTDRVVAGEAYNITSLVLTRGKETLRVEHAWCAPFSNLYHTSKPPPPPLSLVRVSHPTDLSVRLRLRKTNSMLAVCLLGGNCFLCIFIILRTSGITPGQITECRPHQGVR
jgi:hypothetical protein